MTTDQASPSVEETPQMSDEEDFMLNRETFNILTKLIQIELNLKAASKYITCADICYRISEMTLSGDADWGILTDALQKMSI